MDGLKIRALHSTGFTSKEIAEKLKYEVKDVKRWLKFNGYAERIKQPIKKPFAMVNGIQWVANKI